MRRLAPIQATQFMSGSEKRRAKVRAPTSFGVCPRCIPARSGRLTIIVVQHSAQPVAALDGPAPVDMRSWLDDQPVAQSLVIAFAMIMGDKLMAGFPQ